MNAILREIHDTVPGVPEEEFKDIGKQGLSLGRRKTDISENSRELARGIIF
jgi:hypothetical protein